MAAEIFRGRIDDDGGAMIEGAREERRGRVVDDQRDAERAADGGDFGDGEHGELRVRQRLGIVGPRAVIGGAAEILGVGRIDEAHLDALVLQRVREQVPGAAVKVGGADDIVARPRQVLDGKRRRRLPGGERERAHAALDLGDALFEDVIGGVHDARVDVAQLLQREKVRGVLGVAELVRGRLINRHGDRVRGRVGAPAAMKGERFGMTADG